MKKVLVTGATGFIGNYVIRELLTLDVQVIATSVSASKASSQDWFDKVTYISFDLKNFDSHTNYFTFFQKPDAVIHLAWEGLPNYKETFHIEENLPRHYLFLKNMVDNGLKDITITGTCFEYGLQEGCLSEEMPAHPSNAYAIAKNRLREQLEQLKVDRQFGLKWVRLFYMYGKGQSPKSLLSQLQDAIEKGMPSFNMSPGDQLRDYLPIETVARYIVSIALQEKGGIINCCSGKPVRIRDFAEEYIKTRNAHISLNLGYFPYSDIEPRNFWGDTTKLKTILIHE